MLNDIDVEICFVCKMKFYFVTNICIKQIMHSFSVYNQSLTTASGSRLFGSVVRL